MQKKNNFKFYLDFIPLIIVVTYATILLIQVINKEYGLLWKHIFGLLILPFNIGLFFWRHQIAVLALGLTLFLGLFGVLALTHSITVTTWYFRPSDDFKVPIFYGQLIFFLWLIIHFIVSGR